MRLSRDKVNKVAHVITDALADMPQVDFVEDRNTIRLLYSLPAGHVQ